jgi:hypothetical protein
MINNNVENSRVHIYIIINSNTWEI